MANIDPINNGESAASVRAKLNSAIAEVNTLAVTALQSTDIGDSVAAKNHDHDTDYEPLGAVSTHESTFDHALITTAMQSGDLATGTITPKTGDLDFNNLGGGGSSAWGDITGDLANQTDLETRLNEVNRTAEWGEITGALSTQADLVAELAAKQPTSEKAQPNGYAPLDAGGLVPDAHLPPRSLTEAKVVADIAARNALTPDQGDIAIVVDASADPSVDSGSASYIYDGTAWLLLLPPDSGVISVNNQTGIVTIDALLPPGGDEGDILVKDGATDFAAVWKHVDDVIVERVTLLEVEGRIDDTIPPAPLLTLELSAINPSIGSAINVTWRVRLAADNSILWESVDDTVNLASIRVPAGVIEEGISYIFEAVEEDVLNAKYPAATRTATPNNWEPHVNGKPWKQQYDFNTAGAVNITGWTTGTSLPGVLSHSQAIVTNSRVYLLGGMTTAAVNTVYTAPFPGGHNKYVPEFTSWSR